MSDDIEIETLIEQASTEYDADIYVYSGGIDDLGVGKLVQAYASARHRPNAVLILTTNGGSANAAYQIARLFQDTYEQFVLFTPSRCKSAGTLIALGAHRLLMGALSELGPLDVQLLKQNEIIARKSGLLARSTFDALAEASFSIFEQLMLKITLSSGGVVSFRVASELSASMTANLMAPVFSAINPETVGSDHRDLQIALHYGSRLVEHGKNATIATVHTLVHEYPSHDFIIDSTEASRLFKTLERPTIALYLIAGAMSDLVFDESETIFVQLLTPRAQEENEDEDQREAVTTDSDPVGRDHQGEGGDARNPDRPGDPEAPAEAHPDPAADRQTHEG